MQYSELPPCAPLAAHVRCVWTFDSHEENREPQRIVPDGRPELVIHHGAPFRENDVAQPACVFAGQLTRPLWLRSGGRAGVIGVRFRPAGARRFFGAPMHEATDVRVALGTRWPREVQALEKAIARAADSAGRIEAAEAFVIARMAAGDHDDDMVAACVERIESERGLVPVEALAGQAGIGRRQLERRFRDAVGVTPAVLGDIVRFRRVFDVIEHGGERPWTEAAIDAGYFDQSHFIRDFRRFVGCTPTQFIAARPGLATALVEPMSRSSK